MRFITFIFSLLKSLNHKALARSNESTAVRKITDEKILCGRKGAERAPVCICGIVIEEESVCPSDGQRN